MRKQIIHWLLVHGNYVGLALLIGLLLGSAGTEMLRGPEAIAGSTNVSPVERLMGNCQMSTYAVEDLMLSVYDHAYDAYSKIAPRDLTCANNPGNNFQTWETEQGVTFDAPTIWDLWPGAQVKISGPYYLVDGNHMVIHANGIKILNVQDRIMAHPTATPEPNQSVVITPTPRAH